MKYIINKKFLLLICLFIIIPNHLYQQNDKCKYGIRNYDFTKKHNPRNQKRQLSNYLDYVNNDKTLKNIDKFGKIKTHRDDVNELIGVGNNDYFVLMPDSLVGIFKIKKIIEKKNNYQKIENKLIKRSIYFIDLECVNIYNDTCPDFIRLLSIKPLDKISNKKLRKIKIGEEYQMKIFSFFKADCCIMMNENGEIITIVRHTNSFRTSYLIYDIWVPYIDIGSYNLFETKNLKGLYYIK